MVIAGFNMCIVCHSLFTLPPDGNGRLCSVIVALAGHHLYYLTRISMQFMNIVLKYPFYHIFFRWDFWLMCLRDFLTDQMN